MLKQKKKVSRPKTVILMTLCFELKPGLKLKRPGLEAVIIVVREQ